MLLLDNHIYSYIHDSLQQCHEQRVVIYYYILNLSILFVFGVFAVVYLYFAFTTKRTPEEIYERNVRDKEYVLNQIRRYKEEQIKLDSLTQLPILERRRGEEELELRPIVF